MLPRTTFTSIGLILLLSLEVLVVSCNEVERHKTLRFFFDGVTPFSQEGPEDEPAEPNSQTAAQGPQEPLWYVHEPRKDCTLCHGKRGQRRSSPQALLIKPVPQLCYNCHDDFTVSAAFVHGPVAVGQCLFCHNPHKTRVEHLLKEPEPKLCYMCHDVNAVESIPDHLTEQLSTCTNCHNAHASTAKALLKEISSQPNADSERAEAARAAMQDYIRAVRQNDQERLSQQTEIDPAAKTGGTSLFQMFAKVSELVEQGELQKARTYLAGFENSSAITEQEREKIARVLRVMDQAATGAERPAEVVKKEISAGWQKPEDSPAEPDKDDYQLNEQKKEVAELYYHSMALYRAGQLVRAREGFVTVLDSGLVPASMAKTIRDCLSDIDKALAGDTKTPDQKQ